MSIGRGDVEILVHANAPSRGPDDIRYRAYAQAYLDFEPGVRRFFEREPGSESVNKTRIEDESQVRNESPSQRELHESAESYRPPETQLQETATTDSFQNEASLQLSLVDAFISPQLSFDSALDNADSPVFQRPTRPLLGLPQDTERQGQHETQDSEDSWRPSPGSIVPDSQPSSHRQELNCESPSKVLEKYLQQLNTSGNAIPALTQSSAYMMNRVSPVASEEEYVPSTFEGRIERMQSTSSGISSSPPEEITAPEKCSNGVQLNRDGILEEGPGLSNLKRKRDLEELKRADSPAPPSAPIQPTPSQNLPAEKRQRTSSPPIANSAASPPMSSSQPRLQSSPPLSLLPSVPKPITTSPNPLITSTTIRPAPSPISTFPLHSSTLITPSLAHLLRKLSSPALYKPKLQARELRTMERGYWRVDMESWDPGLRERCWDILGQFVGSGKAGWGVWCFREGNVTDDKEISNGEVEGEGRDGQVEMRGQVRGRLGTGLDLKILRIYCWGIVVRHVYLLLFIASENKIQRTEAAWIGGDGQVIVRMNG